MKTAALPLITKDNFLHSWEHVDAIRRKSRQKVLISGAGGFLTGMFFLFSLLFVVNGLIYNHFTGSYHTFLETLPQFLPLWQKVSAIALSPETSTAMHAVKLLVIIYGASVVLFAVLTLVITLLYRPLSRPCPSGTWQENTEALMNAAREAQANSYKTRLSTPIVPMVTSIAAAFALLFAYAFHIQDVGVIVALLTQFPTPDAATNSLLYVLAAYFIIHFLCTILLTLTRFLYRYDVPYDLVIQAEIAALFCDEDNTETATPNRITWAAAQREEAQALELDHAYGKSKQLYLKAALGGDVPAMAHYARHCLIGHRNDSARYWLQRCVDSGEAPEEAKQMLLRMKLHLRHNVQYLQQASEPLSGGRKACRILLTTLTVIWRMLVLAFFIGVILFFVLMYKSGFDPAVFEDLPAAFSHYF